ncbi:MAG: DEAD/DEAH box helicase [Chitinispirillales bacterium]|nr:DEAD/DEAH box helicase [Chitinispirillales bacterium]
MKYKDYELDGFQEDAIKALDGGLSVLVSAPTGCGKTLIAEYAVEKSLKESKKVIYTAPIKALSNQKYRDFRLRFGENSVGIQTGDLTINSSAPILIMTTEIFRNMILEQSNRLNNVLYAIFDEVHFIDDEERGTVWEESIILAPENIRFLCLSATVPNIDELADWMQSVRGSKFEVIKEGKRIVPLKYHLFSGKYGEISIKFLKKMFIADKKRRRKLMFTKPSSRRVIEHVISRDGVPVLYFSFNRKACELNAVKNSRLVLLSEEEKNRLSVMIEELINSYEVEGYAKLKQMKSLWKVGIAYHHAGIIPSVKEIVERLFSTGLIKLLFCTETFALGVNMPARSVIFDDIEKFNGVEFEYITNRSYLQMSGRAGRRGMDKEGNVYCHIVPEITECKEVERLFFGDSEPIRSRFVAQYSTILSLYSRYGENAFEIFRKSLRNFNNGNFILSSSYQKEEDQIRKRLEFLQSEGFLNGQELTPKGKLAMMVSGYEIQAAQLYYTRCFDKLTPEKICVLLGSVIYEQKKKNTCASEELPESFKMSNDGEKVIRKLREKELKFGIKNPIRLLDFSFAAVTFSWVSGCDLAKIGSFGVPEGDIIRYFRMIVQLLRTIKVSINDEIIIEKLNNAIRLINRDAVDAETELVKVLPTGVEPVSSV